MTRNHLFLAAFLVSSVAAAEEPEAEADAPDVPKDTLAAIREKGELRWGMDSLGGAPYVFQDPMDPNRLVGFEVDLANAIAGKLGVRAIPVQGQWDQLLELVARGDFDVALNGIEVATEKQRVALLTKPYYVAAERLTIRKGDAAAPHDQNSLKGRTIGTLPGSLAERILTREGAVVKGYDGGQNEIYDDLRLRRTDGVLLDDPITSYYGLIDAELEVLPGSYGEVQYAIACRLGDDPLKEALDGAIASLAADGTLQNIYERWGIWNPETARLFGLAPAATLEVSEEWERWRAAVGKIPPLSERIMKRYPATLPIFLRGALMTLAVSLCAMLLAILLGVPLALARTYGGPVSRFVATAYVEFFRGTPLLVQLTMIYFGLPEFGVTLPPFLSGTLALGLNYAAAEAENYRAGIGSVPAAQLDAATTLGLTRLQGIRFVVLPQALRVSLPPVTNDFIALLKDSSLVSLVTLTELSKTYSSLANSMRDHLGLGVVVAAFYLLLGLPFARLSRYVELRLARHLRQPVV